MPVFPNGSTTNTPAQIEETMPCVAAMADILNDPGVCSVSALNSAGCTTRIVDCALSSDNPRTAISLKSQTYSAAIGWTSESLDMFPMLSPYLSLQTVANWESSA